jgi:hypothetical protein
LWAGRLLIGGSNYYQRFTGGHSSAAGPFTTRYNFPSSTNAPPIHILGRIWHPQGDSTANPLTVYWANAAAKVILANADGWLWQRASGWNRHDLKRPMD